MSQKVKELLKHDGQWHDEYGRTFALVRWANYKEAIAELEKEPIQEKAREDDATMLECWLVHPIDDDDCLNCPSVKDCREVRTEFEYQPGAGDISELQFTLHNKMHEVVGYLRLKDGWTQFATTDEPDRWVYPCPFKWNHHHCDIIDRQAEKIKAQAEEIKRLIEKPAAKAG